MILRSEFNLNGRYVRSIYLRGVKRDRFTRRQTPNGRVQTFIIPDKTALLQYKREYSLVHFDYPSKA